MATEIRLGSRKFYDDEHFPGGIDRSGFFTIPEANVLINYGYTLNGLFTGDITPQNSDEQAFVDEIKLDQSSSIYEVKLWQKYLKAVHRVTHRASAISTRHEHKEYVENDDEA